jgi:Protein of unknown function (DUF935)
MSDFGTALRSARAAAGPTTERGSMLPDAGRGLAGSLGMGMPGWSYFMERDALEHVPDLQWPNNILEYHRMRSDAQIQGLYLGCVRPIQRYGWFLEPNGSRPEVLDGIAQDLNLPVRGQEDQPRLRQQRRFSFKDHLRHALLAILYGHMGFEQVGEVQADGKWHLRKLGVRMPHSIEQINLERDGGLKSVRQRGMGSSAQGKPRVIDVNRLLWYAWDREGAQWTGRSMLRGIYKNFLLKDTVLRVGAINIERAGGVPVVTGPKGATPEELAELGKMARAFRVGANAGGAIPNGAELNLAKAAGGDEAVEYIKLMNEEMGRGWLMMFMNLGQATTGSYALGSSLIDYVLNTQEVIAEWVCDVFNEHMIEDWVDWNYGPDEQAPLLVYKRTDDRQVALSDLVKLIDAGAITLDDELESWIREEYRMPRRDPNSTTVRTPSGAGSPPSAEPGQSGGEDA